MAQSATQLNPGKIFEVGFNFWTSKVLLTAVELELFTKLGSHSLTASELGNKMGLHPRGTFDFFDTLVSVGFLNREGNGPSAKYRNTEETAAFLDKNKPSYVGGILEMASQRLYRFWHDLPAALKTGQPQNEVRHSQKPLFEALYDDLPRLEQFMSAMAGISRGNFMALAEKFDFSRYKNLLDVGGALGVLSMCVAQKFPNLQCQSFDLPKVVPLAEAHIAKAGLSHQIKAVTGDFFKDPLPKADVITMGMILHDWNLPNKKHLIKAAYDALPSGGALVAVENLIDDERRTNTFGLLMSLNMLIEFGDAFDFTFSDYTAWCKEVGFKRFELIHLAGPCSAAVAYK
ncbi:MAG: methyltransferase [Candidatus Omnitrophica bacterium]|nr:methyltransferase [Candidatus Omnitrophota bacterium]